MTSNFPNQPSGSKDALGDNTDPVSGKTVAEVLGEIVWLMTQDPAARALPVSEIERVVMPAILLRRFHVDYAIPHPGAAPLPVRVRVWGEAGPDAPTLVAALPSACPA